jgi:hypothetical protein
MGTLNESNVPKNNRRQNTYRHCFGARDLFRLGNKNHGGNAVDVVINLHLLFSIDTNNHGGGIIFTLPDVTNNRAEWWGIFLIFRSSTISDDYSPK